MMRARLHIDTARRRAPHCITVSLRAPAVRAVLQTRTVHTVTIERAPSTPRSRTRSTRILARIRTASGPHERSSRRRYKTILQVPRRSVSPAEYKHRRATLPTAPSSATARQGPTLQLWTAADRCLHQRGGGRRRTARRLYLERD